ncbi:YheC/YheD family protein [Jeotgalibacillus proteolyticus]|nr:YheC/YheD family protein [Jeotgalibacillus proteolyticus]
MKFQFGEWSREINVQICNDYSGDIIGLPVQWREQLTIPDELPYKLVNNGTTLKLGPVLALIVFSDLSEMKLSKMNKYREYFSDYFAVQGLTYLCAWNSIDIEKKRIQGYYYDPVESDSAKTWKLGTFPYPNSAYNRTAMPKTVFDDLVYAIGDRVFNSFSNGSFNKWSLWQRLASVTHLRSHLPATKCLTDIKIVDNMLEKYNTIYLKPVSGTLSKGIKKVEKSSSGYLVSSPAARKADRPAQNCFDTIYMVESWLPKLIKKEYIAQQAISVKRYQNRPLDFRVIMQKNEKGKWGCTCIFGKFGKAGNIVTNFSRAGFIRLGVDALRLAFNMSHQEAQSKAEDLEKIAYQICQIFDKYGNYGDLGIDLIIDQELNIWILEVNTQDTYHRFPLHINDQKLYLNIVTSPLRYAEYLAGFS